MLLWALPVFAYFLPCDGEADPADIAEAFARIRVSVDPCGESPHVIELLDKLEDCAATHYRICTNLESDRNSFERPGTPSLLRTITWNPALLNTLEVGCGDDPNRPVVRDATASLLHELAHAAQDCDGLDPNAYEFDAVRIENIYRRAAGMCQRTKYGDDPLPLEMIRVCEPGHCLCGSPAHSVNSQMVDARPEPPMIRSADAVTSADSQPASVSP